MEEEIKQTYHIVDDSYYERVADHPAVNILIDNGEIITQKSSFEQQRLASQKPRGTRLDETGTRIQVRGGRNYTSRKLHISRDELFDDVVVRGLRADGLSTKLGVKNNKDNIGKLLSDLFKNDSRLSVLEEHFKTHRQKSNSAKTMFATMTQEELQFLKAETFPSRIDVHVRDYLIDAFSQQPHKLQSTVQVLEEIQRIFKAVTPHADFLSSHNFQTRGFFLDIILMTCSFLMQIIQDNEGNQETISKNFNIEKHNAIPVATGEERVVKENASAAEILLSVGSDIVNNKQRSKDSVIKVVEVGGVTHDAVVDSESSLNDSQTMPTTVVVEGIEKPSNSENEGWATVEMVDGGGNARYVLLKTDNETLESYDTVKILNMLQSQGVSIDENMEIDMSNENSIKTDGKQSGSDNISLADVFENNGDNLVIDIEKTFESTSQSGCQNSGKKDLNEVADANVSEDLPKSSSTEKHPGVTRYSSLSSKSGLKIVKETHKRVTYEISNTDTNKRQKLDENG